MLIRNCIYSLGILLSLFSLPTLTYSIKNKDSNNYKSLIKVVIAYLVCLYIDMIIMPTILLIDIGLEFLLIELIVFVAVILYMISILLNLIKIKKSQIYAEQKERFMVADIIHIVCSFIALCIMIITLFIMSGRILFWVFGEDSWISIFIYLFTLVAGVLYIIGTIWNLRKDKIRHIKINQNEMIFVIILLLLPTLVHYGSIFKDKYVIDHSDLLLFYHSSGNGGFGDGKNFAYAIRENTCEEFELGTRISGYDINGLLPKTATEIKKFDEIKDYKITFENNKVLVYKGQEIICEKRNQRHYSNIDFERGFYINN